MKKIISVYSILIGSSILILWSLLYLSDNIPELSSAPITIYFHISAESIMAILSILAGILLLKSRNTGYLVYLISSGAIIYSSVNSSGYYANLGKIGMVYMFGVIAFIQLSFSIYLIYKLKKQMLSD